MSRPTLRFIVILAALTRAASASAEAPQFKFSDLPPPVADAAPPSSLYDIFATRDVSPLGTPASTIRPADLFDKAASFLPSAAGRPGNPAEAEYWLKRAVVTGTDDTGKRRSWAAMTLGLLLYQSADPTGHAAARDLWELAGAWNNATALCNLGELAEVGDNVAGPDVKKAVVWYERAKDAGCAQADAALSRLKR